MSTNPEPIKTFTIREDTHSTDMGMYWIRCYKWARQCGSLRTQPNDAYAHGKRMIEDGWWPANEETMEFLLGMHNVHRAFDRDKLEHPKDGSLPTAISVVFPEGEHEAAQRFVAHLREVDWSRFIGKSYTAVVGEDVIYLKKKEGST